MNCLVEETLMGVAAAWSMAPSPTLHPVEVRLARGLMRLGVRLGFLQFRSSPPGWRRATVFAEWARELGNLTWWRSTPRCWVGASSSVRRGSISRQCGRRFAGAMAARLRLRVSTQNIRGVGAHVTVCAVAQRSAPGAAGKRSRRQTSSRFPWTIWLASVLRLKSGSRRRCAASSR